MFAQPTVGHRLGVGTGLHLPAHFHERCGVQHAGHLVDR